MPRNAEAGPLNVPCSGRAFRWSHATATRMRLRFPDDAVGRVEVDPSGSRQVRLHPGVRVPATDGVGSTLRHEDVPADEARSKADRANGVHHEHGEVPTAPAAAPERLGRCLDALLGTPQIRELFLDAARHRMEQAHRRRRSRRRCQEALDPRIDVVGRILARESVDEVGPFVIRIVKRESVRAHSRGHSREARSLICSRVIVLSKRSSEAGPSNVAMATELSKTS